MIRAGGGGDGDGGKCERVDFRYVAFNMHQGLTQLTAG